MAEAIAFDIVFGPHKNTPTFPPLGVRSASFVNKFSQSGRLEDRSLGQGYERSGLVTNVCDE